MPTHQNLRGPWGSCYGSRSLGLRPLFTPRTLSLVPHSLLSQLHGSFASQLALAFAVPRGVQLYLHRSQLVPQFRIHQQEALQLLLQLGEEKTTGLVGGMPRTEGAPPSAIAPPSPHRFVLLAPLQ